jgi:hypothetical protein
MTGTDRSLWCRLEMEGSRVRRVNVMHPNGEILASWPPERFEPDLLRRMRTGEIRATFEAGEGQEFVALRDGSGQIVFSDPVPGG